MNMVLEYYPWSKKVLRKAIKDFSDHKLPCLDLELSARCNLKNITTGCIYCDSFHNVGKSHSRELTLDEVIRLINQGIELGLSWLYICGLGEPKDDPKIKEIVRYLFKKDIRISMFSNGVNYSNDEIMFFYQHKVNLIIKCDSLNPFIFNSLLGGEKAIKLKIAESIYKTINKLIEAGYSQSEEPSLALSIVPTKVNIKYIPEVIKFCKEWNIFPLLGELEKAGRAIAIYNKLAPSMQQMQDLWKIIKKILGYEYEIPMCPAAFAGLHINNIGECIVHRASGASCPWFCLEEPDIETLGNVRTHTLKELRKRLIKYRDELKESGDLMRWIRDTWSQKRLHHIFGGCGGLKLMDFWTNTHHKR